MPVLRNKLSTTVSGGPRQFAEVRDTFVLKATGREGVDEIRKDARGLGLNVLELQTENVVILKPEGDVSDVIRRLRSRSNMNTRARQAIDEVRDSGDDILDVGRATLDMTRELLDGILALDGVQKGGFANTLVDYGPENLRFSPDELEDIVMGEDAPEGTMAEMAENIGLTQAWQTTTGEQATVAIFDTAYAKGVIAEDRIVETFHGDSVDSVYDSAEGHGTMCAGAAAASAEHETPFNGAAPDADVILVRITDGEGQIRSDIIAEAWDWLAQLPKEKPIVTNHSYGTPLCSGRPRVRFCESPEIDLIKRVNEDAMVTSVYAAGNEAMTCGHRPSGLTNGITGGNSIAEVITVGALRFDGRDAQRYSSHGRGDCAPIADPKPNVSCALPNITYYGVEDGWKMKDMGMGVGGSGGGTSHASPTTAGIIALMQSASMEQNGEALETEEIKQIIQNTAKPPRPTQVNQFGAVLSKRGYDARFGFGQVRPAAAVREVIN